ncbi:MAG: ECF transporter S component [Bacillota bacterium]
MKLSTRQVVITGLLGALTVVLGLAPIGGFIPVPTPAGSATTMHVPAILAGILEGPVVGALVGLMFGAFSFWRAQTQANPIAKLMFTDPLVAFLPRLLIGVLAYYAFRLTTNRRARPGLALVAALVVGHTVHGTIQHFGAGYVPGSGGLVGAIHASTAATWFLVLAASVLAGWGTFVLAKDAQRGPALAALAGTTANTVGVLGLSVARGYLPAPAALAVGVTHGVPEIIVAMVITSVLHGALLRARGVPRAR